MSMWTQYFPPPPKSTPANLASQAGKVFLVTGGASGVGFELCSMLYASGASVYIAGRSEEKGRAAITEIEQRSSEDSSSSSGKLHFLFLDLSDLSTIAPAAKEFLQHQWHLDVLWNNAGVGATFDGETARAAQAELPIQFVTNNVGPFLFTKHLQPALERAKAPRVVWAASAVVDFQSPKGGMQAKDFENPGSSGVYNYGASKVGNWFLASDFAKRETKRVRLDSSSTPILHIAVNPGNLRTPIWRTWSWLFIKILSMTLLHDARFGAYSVLWAGLETELTPERDGGSYVIPWGRMHPNPRVDILHSLRSIQEGGSGLAARFYK